MAEAPSSRYVRFEGSKDDANNAPKNGHSTSVSATASKNAMDLLLYDYVKLRKVRAATQKGKRTAIDKKLQKWRKGWLVMTTKTLLDCTLEYYKDEDEWLSPSKSTNVITISELLKDIVTVEHIRSSYKSHVMCIIFGNYSILIEFKSKTIMESWVTKINNIKDYFLVQLTTSSNEAIEPGTYLIHVQDKKIVGYDAMEHQKIVWTWDSADLYGFRLQKNIVPEIEMIIGSESPAHGNFHFIGPSLTGMCNSIMDKVLSLSSDEKDGLLEDLSQNASDKGTKPIGKLKEWKQTSLLNINPSYGVLPRLPQNAEKTERGTIKDAVYANDLRKLPEIAEETKRGTIKDDVYVNDPKPVVEEYEYVDIPPRSREQSHTPTKQLLTQNQFESSAEYDIPCT